MAFSLLFTQNYSALSMKLYPLYTGLLVVGLSSHIVAQTNENISTTLSSVDRIKQTMLSYEKSHTAISTDTLPQINGTNTLRNSTGQVLKT